MSVHIKFRDLEQIFEGNPNEVWFLVNKFFSETVPSFEILSNVTLTVDLQRLMEDCKGILAITPEGIAVLASKELLTDNEMLMLYLLAGYIARKLGLAQADAVSKESLQNSLGKSAKIISTRLGELTKKGHVIKLDGDYKISTVGIRALQDGLLPTLRAESEI